ncbi:tyrosine-type recombinase/integrase [Mariprofundus sp. NF]|uniref:tyrosine-type recombinase/integrase n=1 Tax=Mariprofundus sp. NF TaxID=2608716 RepID=UPI00159FBB5D|nr:tyrosine-type recombinase/integrase [Mariprofundus sp. NF]NWF37971.1 tyrosine-type recombinase/integrase [Mariprofundus sp. NF]
MLLTDKEVQNKRLPEGKKQLKLRDGNGLYLLINKSGKYWHYDYKINGNRKTYSFGTYPAIPLAGKKVSAGYSKGARDFLVEVKALIKQGIDPSLKKQEDRQLEVAKATAKKKQAKAEKDTFEKVARRWWKLQTYWSSKHARTVLGRLESHTFPWIGNIPVNQLTKGNITESLQHMVDANVYVVADRVHGYITNVLEFAEDHDLIEAAKIPKKRNIIPARKAKPTKAITESKRIGELMRAIDGYKGTTVVCAALKLLPLLAVRTGELRHAHWAEMDLGNALWTVPAPNRKLKEEFKLNPENVHYVPLSKQAVELLKELWHWTGRGNHVFPSNRGDSRPMSENTINGALSALGFKEEMTGHGTRTMFSTILNADGFNPDAIETQLQHKSKDSIRATYNRATYREEREMMMQYWADWLDGIRKK